jgi:hypothetical protein
VVLMSHKPTRPIQIQPSPCSCRHLFFLLLRFGDFGGPENRTEAFRTRNTILKSWIPKFPRTEEKNDSE